jgi:hypothetical protein
MKMLVQIGIVGMVLLIPGGAQELPPAPPPPAPEPSWSLVYLPSLEWTDAEAGQAVELLRQLKPDLVVSMDPCPFAETIRSLECKPALLDQTQRAKSGAACGIPPLPLAAYADTSTLHPIGDSQGAASGLVWLSAGNSKEPFIGPRSGEDELHSLAKLQIRRQFGERQGEVVFLVDASVPTPPEQQWILPVRSARFEQAASEVTGFTCIRPGQLRTEVPAIEGIAPRVPLVHWISSSDDGIIWETLPIDGGPAIQRSVSTYNTPGGGLGGGKIAWLKAPAASLGVPVWMDDYINENPAIGIGENIKRVPWMRRFGWSESGVTRDTFDVLRSSQNPGSGTKPETPELPRGAVRSPGNLFSVTVGQLDAKGMYPEEGDDGINVYLEDHRGNKSRHLYFAGLYSAWPSSATWFTDRYVITSGIGRWLDPPEDSDSSPRFHPQTIRLFDLLTGRSFEADGIAKAGFTAVPTERIFFPSGNYEHEIKWRSLWRAVEAGYQLKPEPAPFPAEEAAAAAKLPKNGTPQWKDLGIWPPPETWQLAPDKDVRSDGTPDKSVVETGDPYLSCTQTGDGQRRYTIAISGYHESDTFWDRPPTEEAVAHAELLVTGGGHLPQLETIRRMGDRNRYLLIAGTYLKPGAQPSEKGKWMLLTDLLRHRTWSAHW